MYHSRAFAVHFRDEHTLLEREETKTINATTDVRIKDAPCVSAMIAAVIRLKSVLHEILDPCKITFTCLSDQYVFVSHFDLLCRAITSLEVCVARRLMVKEQALRPSQG